MDHIPAEILHLVFSRLDLKDRLECMLAYQLWCDTLDHRSLLQDVYLTGYQYPYFKDMIERLPYRGNQVEKLVMKIGSGYNFDKRKLCNTFPNLREFELTETHCSSAITNYMNKKFHLLHATSKLERITEFGECELTCQLAISNACRHLYTLDLDFRGVGVSTSSIAVPQLKNMPVLRFFQLSKARMSLMELELLHSNLPSIESFRLDLVNVSAGEIPLKVEPATSIIELGLEICNVDDINTHIQLYKYMAKKYSSLSCFERTDMVIRDREHNYTRDVYNQGILPLYQMMAPHIVDFEFENYCDGLNAFNKFDTFGIKLDSLLIQSPYGGTDDTPFLEELTQSQQSKYIFELELCGINPQPLTMLINMEVLQSLSITYNDDYAYPAEGDKKPIRLDQLVENCPATLTTLSTEYVLFKFLNQSQI
jgi:hypothetical protein